MKKVILITGTSTGVGLSSALAFGRKGYKVYASMRNLAKRTVLEEAAKAENLPVEIIELDVTSMTSIQSAVDLVMEKEGRLDILLNNAGAGFAKTTEHATEEEIQWQMDVNYFGVVHTTKAVLPIMRKQKCGHVINVTSVGGLVGQPFNELYCGAKFAVEGYTEALASYVTKAFNIHFTNVEPGGIATEFVNNAMTKMAEGGMIEEGDPYAPVFNAYLSGMQSRSGEELASLYQTPEQVAEVILEVAQQEEPVIRVRTSDWAEDLCQLKTEADPTGLKLRDKVVKQFLG
ncbi:SDR family oxidoreductase [Persicobacter psychrovividus]|uniref:Short-chain dehydrogenase/reductase n=1 Tax=Persicobacter psychrovividus TaxID=387638 RepID=A0ABM7VA71_9BACT|nr:short-chain dehydrogenase/reductase [Persicobacter psychrovividus]